MPESPLNEIENRKAQQDLGTFGYRVWQGARSDGASWLEALVVTVAYFRGVAGASNDGDPDA